MSKGPITP